MPTVEQPSIDYKQLYEQQVAVIEQLSQQLAAHDDKVASLSAEIARLRKLIFGVKVERFVPAAGVTAAELQLSLQLQAETVAHCKLTSATSVSYVRTNMELVPAKPKAHPGRMKLPDHLRREVILLQPEGCRFRFMVSPLSDLRYPPIQIHGIPPCFMLKGIW